MHHNERERERRPEENLGVGSDEQVTNRSTESDAERQADGNLGNERNRNADDRTSDSDRGSER